MRLGYEDPIRGLTWPRSLDQEPINIGDANYHPLYPYGYGLRTHTWGR